MPNGNFEESADIVLSQQGVPQSAKTKEVPFWPILLLCSTVLNVVLVILLIQKTSRIGGEVDALVESNSGVHQQVNELKSKGENLSKESTSNFDDQARSSWKPGGVLPGETPKTLEINSAASPAQYKLSEYESTKLLVQQVFSSYSNSEETGKVVIDAPVRYASSDMLWSEEQIQEAREILAALRNHQQNVMALKNEAQELSDAWGGLIQSSRPFSILRADSPSLRK